HLFAAIVVYSVTRSAVSQYSDRARTEHDTFTYTLLQICWPVLGLFLGLLLIQIIGPVTEAMLAGYALAQTLSLIIAAKRLGFGRTPKLVEREAIRQAIVYGMPLVGGAIFIWIA